MRITCVLAMIGLGLVSMAEAALECPARLERTGNRLTVRFAAPSGQHFNLESPNAVTVDGSPVVPEVREREASVDVPEGGKSLDVALFLCEDGGTLCRAFRTQLAIDGGRLVKARGAATKRAKSVAGDEGPDAHGWYTSAEPALAAARAEGKPLLVDFWAVWCPPCNALNETVFNTERFRASAARFILVKLDADSEASWSLKECYRVGGYPTIVFASSDGDEILRLVGSRPLDEFLARMDEAHAQRERSRATLAKLARRGDLEADRKLAHLELEFGEFTGVLRRFERRSAELPKTWTAEDARLLARARVAAARKKGKKEHAAELERALALDAGDALALEWASALTNATDDEAAKTRAAERVLAAADRLEKDPATLAREGLSLADLCQFRGSAYQDLKRPDDAKRAFAAGAAEYDRMVRASGLTPTQARGYSLERGYCLGRAGKTAEARALYDSLEREYPRDFSFPFASAGLLDGAGDSAAALPYARRALDNGYGDNRLRAAERLAKILRKLKKDAEAKRVVKEALAKAKVPADPHNRTHRYVKALRELSAAL
jgi:thioredoxin-like negative regulator of GroEL